MIPGPSELLLILIIVIMVFGAKRIPEIMGGLGQGIKTFKKAMEDDEPQRATQPPPPAPAAPPVQPVQPAAATEVQQEKTEPK